MVDLEGQDHGPSSSSVGDNDDDFIVYSKEDNATIAMECTEEVFLAKIIHGDGAKVIKVGEVLSIGAFILDYGTPLMRRQQLLPALEETIAAIRR
ncbi:hypothetical protein Sjap_017932 [Stephania japonica]|uniref:Uncharacterized protein n=1 Tax=Stephania japonica TaxID=461633 RepID=A0AAP0I745_9MAGN